VAVFSKQNWTYLSQLERFKATFTLALAQSKGNIRINFLNCSGTLQKLADLRDYNGLARMGSDLSLRQLCQIAPFVLNRHEHMVVKLLEFGADLEARTQGGSTALACAAYHGHTNIVTALLRAGADVNGRQYAGRTPIIRAASQQHKEAQKFLYHPLLPTN